MNNQQILGLSFEEYWDIVNEYAYDLDRFSTHDKLLAALKNDTRIKKSEDNVPYYDLISEIISKGEGCVCDLCDSIFALDDAFDIDYADPDNENDMKILKGLEDMENGENVVCICQDCYHKLLKAGKK